MLTKLSCPIKSFTHIVHVADIHIRLTKRHEEYIEVFNKFYEEVKKTPTTTAICILGDLFHNKSALSPECVLYSKDFLLECAKLRPTILIAGNHDATLENANRMDSLTPIVSALNHSNLFYLKDKGLYGIGDILFNNFSIFSEPSEFIHYDEVPKVYKNEYVHHIALYHGPVNSALTDLGFYMVNKAMPVEIFDGHHIALLGDIHRLQDLQHFDNLNSKPAVRYAGSMIQQNFGESTDGHGFSLWNLKDKTYKHIEILNDYGFFTVEINKGQLITDLTNIPKKARIHAKCFESVVSEVKAAVATIKGTTNIQDNISYERIASDTDPAKLSVNASINLSDIADIAYQNKLITDFLKDKCKTTDQTVIDAVLTLNTSLNGKIDKDKFAKNVRWKPKKFEFDNMFSYGEGNVVDFTKVKDVMGLFAPNACGKSSIFSALSFCIFDKFDRGYKASHILNVHKTNFRCKFNFEVNGIDFFIERKGQSDRKGNVKVDVKFWKEENGKVIELNGEARRNTNDIIKDCVGVYEDFTLTAHAVQNTKNNISFIEMGQSERKDLLSQFIGLTIFDKLLEVAMEESKELSGTLKSYKKDDHETQLQNFSNELSSLVSVFNDETNNISVITNKKDKLNNDILEETKKLKEVSVKVIDVQQVTDNISKCGISIESSNNQINKLLINLNEIKEKISVFDNRIVELESKNVVTMFKEQQKVLSDLAKLNQHLEVAKVQVGAKMKKIEMLKTHEYDPNCKYCVNSVFVKDATKASKELETDRVTVKQMLDDRDVFQKKSEDLQWVVELYEEYTDSLQKKNKLKDEQSKLEISVRKIESDIVNVKSKKSEWENDIIEYNKQLDSIQHNKAINQVISEMKQTLSNLEFDFSFRNKKVNQMNGRLEVLKNQIDTLNATITKIKQLEKEFEVYSLYIKSVNRDGLPYMVICNTVPEIEREVNNILNQMVEFHLSIETDGKNVTPYIVYDDARWPIEMASAFEKFVSSLAIRVALISISNLPRPNFLVVDEGFGVIDSANMPAVQTLLSFLKTNFDFIIIISHLDALKDMVDKHIEITKDNGFSSVKFV
jgi:DNA repair exonuclease SbcCD ATPase subunit